MANWGAWQSSGSSSWGNRNQWQSSDWSDGTWQSKPSDSGWKTTTTTTPTLPTSFASDYQHYDKTPIGKGAHVLHRQVQPTEWSRKSGLAGRDVTDIRAYELSHRGLGDFSFRLLSEGRHQSIVWARSGSESVLMTALLKKIRESNVSIDDAAKACHTGAPPDKHKEAMRFMEPLAQELLKCVLAKAPVRTSDASDELPKLKPNWLSTALLCLHLNANLGRMLIPPTQTARGQSPRCLLLIRMPRMPPRARRKSFFSILKGNWILAPREPPTTMSTNGWPVTKPSQSLKANIRSLSSMYRLFRDSSKQELLKTNWFRQQSISDGMPNLHPAFL